MNARLIALWYSRRFWLAVLLGALLLICSALIFVGCPDDVPGSGRY